LTRQEAANPTYESLRKDAERRLQKLDPQASRMADIFREYNDELLAAIKKNPDRLTQDEAVDRVRLLKLGRYVAAEKLPKATVAVAGKSGSVPPDIERALKVAGWQTITGTWKKKADNIYEVTDGKVEANYANGALQVTIQKGGSGTVKAMVRNNHRESYGTYSGYGSGYGVKYEGHACQLYTPYSPMYNNSTFRPWLEREIAIPDALPKTTVLLTISGSATEIHINGKKEKAFNYNITKDGPFIIEVEGTVTIEFPAAKGQ
jgi:hypothetical protein